MIRLWLSRIAKGLGLVVVLVLLFYVAFVHPNDSRVAVPKVSPGEAPQTFFERRATLLTSGLVHALDLERPVYEREVRELERRFPRYALTRSSRFTSPYQVYLPVGSYPYRLDARDAVYVPAGRTLTVEPGIDGEVELRLGLYAPEEGATLVLEVTQGDDGESAPAAPLKVGEVTYVPPPPGPDETSVWYRSVGRWLNVDPADGHERWQDGRVKARLASGSRVRLTCSKGRNGCLVSDVGFFVPTETAPENIILIVVDTLRADALAGGNAPRLEELAKKSMVFSNALAPGNMTSPSTNALLSCRLPTELGSWAFSYGVSSEGREEHYRKKQPSFPAVLGQHGYDAAMIGNVSVISEVYGVGVNHGFPRQVAIETEAYDTPQVTREAIRWLKDHGDHRFFLYLHMNGPHGPYRAPLRDIAGTWPGFGGLRSYPQMLRWLYQSEVRYTDRYLDRFFAALRTLGLEERTLVVLTADHGDHFTPHDFARNETGPDFEGSYFDHGATLLNDEIRVPLIVRHPTVGSPGVVTDFVSTLDVGPMLLDLADAREGSQCTGNSLVPYLIDGDGSALRDRVLGSEGFQGRAIVFDNRYKYVRSYQPTDKRIYSEGSYGGVQTLFYAPEQLYDLEVDADEHHDLVDAEPDLVARARELYGKRFGVRETHELVIEAPAGGKIEARFAPGTGVKVLDGDGQVFKRKDGVRFVTKGRTRILLELSPWDQRVPDVRVGGRSVAVARTTLRLPGEGPFDQLPVEVGGVHSLLEPPRTALAYVRRVADDGREDRRITANNPEFEKVLREWGYLNDR